VTTVALPPFWSLVEAHGDELLVHARRLTGDDNCEDVLQEALLRALRAYDRLQHAEHLRAWLYRITTTTAYDLHRSRRREVPVADAGASLTAAEPAYDGFEELIAPLAGTARDALRLRFVEDLDYEAIATRLDTTPMAARQRVSTALRSLRKRIEA
jgi:RNA polymerase sigma-70 factor (ECF subfamily)